MAQIAEDLLLLLLDNASAQPALDRERCDRVLAGAVLFDLAYACRVRPSVPGEPVDDGKLVALAGTGALDPLLTPAFQLLLQRPLTPAAALSKLRKDGTERVAEHLERLGEVRRMPLSAKRFRPTFAWPMARRDRVALARSALLSALFDRQPPTPPTAGIVTLLHAVDGLGALLSLNDRGWRWVHARATEISSGSWVSEYHTQPALPEMNLAVTASAVKAALT
jgi:hypothetical protein